MLLGNTGRGAGRVAEGRLFTGSTNWVCSISSLDSPPILNSDTVSYCWLGTRNKEGRGGGEEELSQLMYGDFIGYLEEKKKKKSRLSRGSETKTTVEPLMTANVPGM